MRRCSPLGPALVVLLTLAGLLMLAGAVSAQSFNGTITGVTRDSARER